MHQDPFSTLHDSSQKSLMGVLQSFQGRFRALRCLLAFMMVAYAVPLRANPPGDEATIKNIVFKVTGQVVEVYYDLIAPPNLYWNVTLVLKKRFAKGFLYLPLEVSGDVGEKVIPGENKKITWRIASEFPQGLPGEDCFFAVNAEVGAEVEGGINSTYWIIGGAAVVGGILTAILLSKGSKAVPPVPGGTFPDPPARP